MKLSVNSFRTMKYIFSISNMNLQHSNIISNQQYFGTLMMICSSISDIYFYINNPLPSDPKL